MSDEVVAYESNIVTNKKPVEMHVTVTVNAVGQPSDSEELAIAVKKALAILVNDPR